jgi:hypothetical protein
MFISVRIQPDQISENPHSKDGYVMAKDITIGMKLPISVTVIIYDTSVSINTLADVCGVGKVTNQDGTPTGDVSFAFTEIDHEDEHLMIPEWEYVRVF